MQEAQDIEPLVYTAKQLAKKLLVSPRTLRRWAASNQLPPPILPGRWDRAAFDEWYADKSVTGGQLRTSAPCGSENH